MVSAIAQKVDTRVNIKACIEYVIFYPFDHILILYLRIGRMSKSRMINRAYCNLHDLYRSRVLEGSGIEHELRRSKTGKMHGCDP